MFGVFLKQIIEKTPLTVVGDGNQSRDFVYVTDVAKAFYLAAVSNVSGEVFNIGGGNPRKINDIVKILNTHSVQIPERPGEPRITWADITKARNVLSWVPIISLEDGIKKMLDDIDYWENAPLWNSNSIANATQDWFKFLGNQNAN